MAFINEDISIKTIIGEHSVIKGNLSASGYLRIDGDVDGDVETDGILWIGENARIHGNINARSAVIGGIVLGDLCAPEEIKLLSSAAIIGNVQTKNLQIEENVIIHGHCISLSNEEEYTQAVSRQLATDSFKSKVRFDDFNSMEENN